MGFGWPPSAEIRVPAGSAETLCFKNAEDEREG